MRWQDITSYSQNDTERKPRVLECSVSNIKFKVHKYVGLGNSWFLSSDYVGVHLYDLDTKDLEEAKEKAVKNVSMMLTKTKEEIASALEELCEKDMDKHSKQNEICGCDCCQGDKALFWKDNENNAFIDRHGDILVTVKDSLLRFKVGYCPNCGKKIERK